MPPRLLELCPADWLNLFEAFLNKIMLYCIGLSRSRRLGGKSWIWQAVTLDGASLFFSWEHLILDGQNGAIIRTLTLDLNVIVGFIHWSQSVSLRLWSEGVRVLSHSVQLSVANRRRVDFLVVNHYCKEPLCPRRGSPTL